MAQVEVYKTVTIGGQNFIAGVVYDDKKFGEYLKDLKNRDLIGPVTKATRKRLEAEKAATERPERTREIETPEIDEAVNTGGGASPDETPNAGEQ